MGGNASGGASSSESKPLNADERSAIFQGAMRDLSHTNPGYVKDGMLTGPQYEAPTYTSAPIQQISNGDLQSLQKTMTSGYTAPLDYAKAKDTQNFNNSAGAKGIWSSGLAVKGENDINAGYAPQYAQAGANATNAAFGLQNSQNQSVNALRQQDTNAQNTFNLANASTANQSKWKPLDYLAGIWNGTGGQTSNSSSFNAGAGFTL